MTTSDVPPWNYTGGLPWFLVTTWRDSSMWDE